MGRSEAEAADVGTQTTNDKPAQTVVPSLTRSARIQDGDNLIPLDTEAFRIKMGGSIRTGTDIHGPRGSAAQAVERAVITAVDHLARNEQLTKKQRIPALREASKHPKPDCIPTVQD